MIVIGEKINGSLPNTKAILQERNAEALIELARRQARGGARYIDVNVATGEGSREEEVRTMQWAVRTLLEHTEQPLSIDSADAAVIEAGLEACNSTPGIINSVSAEQDRLKEILPLAARFEVPVVALAMNAQGIPKSVQGRLEACRTIASACEQEGIPLERVFFDPLVLPVSADITQGKVTLETLKALNERLPEAKTILGLSNISYGLPARSRLNAAFLHMAVFVGLDAVIMDPTDPGMMGALRTAEILVGKDRHCRRYTRFSRGSE